MERGSGSPLVLVPGIQGRWEWMAPTIDALARTHHVLSFSLTDTTGDSAFDSWLVAIDRLLDRAGAPRAALVGASFGGLVAARYAARRPERVAALVLVSPPAPGWRLDAETARYARRPRTALPFFAWRTIRRLTPEILASFSNWGDRLAFLGIYTIRALRWPVSPRRMAAWAFEWMKTDIASDCAHIVAPTLIVTGDPRLDRVVSVSSSLEYLSLIRGARHAILPQTGHVGLIAKPGEFAALVDQFLEAPTSRPPGQRPRPRPITARPLECG